MRGRGSAGFTLVELLVVMVIALLAAALVASHLPLALSGVRLDGASREVAGALRAARGLSVFSNRPVAFIFDPDAGAYRYGDQRGTIGAAEDVRFSIHGTGPPRAASERTSVIRFFPDGTSTGGRVALSQGTRTRTVRVEPLSGQVSLGD